MSPRRASRAGTLLAQWGWRSLPCRGSQDCDPAKNNDDPSAARRDHKLAHTEASAREAGSVGKLQYESEHRRCGTVLPRHRHLRGKQTSRQKCMEENSLVCLVFTIIVFGTAFLEKHIRLETQLSGHAASGQI